MTYHRLVPFALVVLLVVVGACAEAEEEAPAPDPSPMADPGPAPTDPVRFRGIDVSHYQGDVDWAAVRAAGYTFAFTKATEGTDEVDPMFAANWAGIDSAGMTRGAYHFFDPDAEDHGIPVLRARRDELQPLLDEWGLDAMARLIEGPMTIEYPEEKTPVYPRFRGRHKLHKFEDTGLEKCVGCSLCAAACPADCIRVVAAENIPGERVSAGERYAAVYEINLSRCIFCGNCTEICPVDCIKMLPDFELADYSREALVLDKKDLTVSGRPRIFIPIG